MNKFKDGNMKIPIFNWATDVDPNALQQARDVCEMDIGFHHLGLMPDCHLGYSLPIGGVLATKDVIVPSFVGFDIGCGVTSCKLPLKDLDIEQVREIKTKIRMVVPVGFKHHETEQHLNYMPEGLLSLPEDSIVMQQFDSARKQIGTLGGGNHFIEVQKGDDGYIYLMIHSGSRNLGLKVAKHYHNVAKEKMVKWKTGVKKDLSYLSIASQAGYDYITEMNYCVAFAKASRALMMKRCIDVIRDLHGDFLCWSPVDVAHNYAALETHYGEKVWVHRKGATRAFEGDIGLIPGSQGRKSYIVEGRGNPESFKSCSHGAGRSMGRADAKRRLNLEEEIKKLDDLGLAHDLRGISNLDESDGSYKDIEVVMENQNDLIKIKTTLTPLGSLKDTSKKNGRK